LNAHDDSAGVIRFELTTVDSAGQHEFSGGLGLLILRPAVIDSKENRQTALLATHTEIPSLVSRGPLQPVHGSLLERLSLQFIAATPTHVCVS